MSNLPAPRFKRQRTRTVRSVDDVSSRRSRLRTTERQFPLATYATASRSIQAEEGVLQPPLSSEEAAGSDPNAAPESIATASALPSLSLQDSGASSGNYQSHAQRRANEEANYVSFRQSRQTVLSSEAFQTTEVEKAETERNARADRVRSAAYAATCPLCGYAAAHCGPPVARSKLTVVTLLEFFEVQIPIFLCTRCPSKPRFHLQPEMAGAFGSSPVLAIDLTQASESRDRRWFDLTLIKSFSKLRRANPSLSVEAFTESMFAVHLERQGCILPSQETVRKQLGKATEEFENIEFEMHRRISERLEDGSLLDCCLACSSRRGEDATLETGRCHLYVDGNFRLPHLNEAGAATTHAPPIRQRVVPDNAVREFCTSVSVPAPQGNECNDFQADAALARKHSKYDITGIFGAFCRHGCLILALNMTTGERWSYATFLLDFLISRGIVPGCLWYDINCRYKGHFGRWLQMSSTYNNATKELAASIKWPLPTWHHSMHNAECQMKNSYRTMTGVGRGAGEPPEAAWSYLGAYGRLLQYASLPSRQAALERIAANWNAGKMLGLPMLLERMFRRAVREKAAAEAESELLIGWGMQLGLGPEQLQAASGRALHTADESNEVPVGWESIYVDHVLQLDAIRKLNSGIVSPDLLLATSSLAPRLSAVTKIMKLEQTLLRIEEEQGVQVRWKEGDQAFNLAFQSLCNSKQRQLQRKISRLVQHLLYLEALFSAIATRRHDTKKLQRSKDNQRQKVRIAAQQWYEWTEAAAGRRSSLVGKLPADIETDMMRGQYPWQSSENEGAVEALGPLLQLQLDLQSRCTEEMQMLCLERQAASAAAERQLVRARQWILELEAGAQQLTVQLQQLQEGADTSMPQQEGHHRAQQIFQLKMDLDQKLGMKRRLALKQQQLEALQRKLSLLHMEEPPRDATRASSESEDDAANSEISI